MTAVVTAMTVTQSDLITRAKTGDEAAFTILLQPVITPAYRLAGGMLHDPHAAEDVVQDASLKAWRKIAQLRPGAEMRPWFLGIVANECRSARRTKWWSVLKLAEPEPRRAEHADEVTAYADLRHAIRRLGNRRRLMVILHWYLDLPLVEVAAITGSSEDAVKSELARAVRQLRSFLHTGETR